MPVFRFCVELVLTDQVTGDLFLSGAYLKNSTLPALQFVGGMLRVQNTFRLV
jgi:hypothetical protein